MVYKEMIKKLIKDKYEEYKSARLKIALVGESGVGKSSLINQIIGKDIFEVGVPTDMTMEPREKEYKDLIITDLPGYGTTKFPVEKWAKDFKVAEHDLYIFVFSGKLLEADGAFFGMLEKWRKERQHPYFIVRNKADLIYDDVQTDEELRGIIREDVRNKAGLPDAKVYFTSCLKGQAEGIEELRKAILALDQLGVKKGKFTAAFRAQSLEDLQKKKEQCNNDILVYAAMAGIVGWIPIPGVDMALDVSLVFEMFGSIRSAFDLEETKTDEYIKRFGPVAQEVVKYFSKEKIIAYLEKYAAEYTGKTVTKYIPFIGQAIAVGLSFLLVEAAGKAYLENCYNLAKAILKENLEIYKGAGL